MTVNELLFGGLLSGVFILAAAENAPSRVFFSAPKEGETVTSPVHAVFGVNGLGLAPAGDPDPMKGHYLLLIDAGPVQKGLAIPENGHSQRLDKAQTETNVKLPPGKHLLTLQFVNGTQQSFGPELSQTIAIQVK